MIDVIIFLLLIAAILSVVLASLKTADCAKVASSVWFGCKERHSVEYLFRFHRHPLRQLPLLSWRLDFVPIAISVSR